MPAGIVFRDTRTVSGHKMQPIIEVEGLTKCYKKAEAKAVDGISFTVAPGEFFALLGPNGAGKTTTISILTTTLAPTSGSVRVAGYDILKDADAVRRNVGILFQQPSLDLNLTAEENIRFHAILYGLYPFRPTFSTMPPAYQQRVHELAAVLGLERDIFKPIRAFSSGMKRKLEIVRSLMHHPSVLFLDEPTAGLDAASRRSLWQLLREMRVEYGTTLFLTTHYLEEAEQADTICILDRGRIAAYGTPSDLKPHLPGAYLLVDAAPPDRERLRAELARLGAAPDEGPPFKIALNGRSLYHTLRSVETPLTLVNLRIPTL